MTRLTRLIPIIPVAIVAACAVSRPPQSPPPVPVPAIAILTVETEPKAAIVHVGDRAWSTRPDGTIVEEFRAGDVRQVTVSAPGYVTSAPVTVTMTAGRMTPIRVELARVPITAKVRWGRTLCASDGSAVTDPNFDVPRFAAWLESVKAECTRVWLFDAWAIGERDGAGKFLPGQYDGGIPVLRSAGPGSPFDLTKWNDAYFTDLRKDVETFNQHGVFAHVTFLELYTWSQRKAGLPYVPDPNKQPYRYNVNGVRWGDPDDPTFFALPDRFLRDFTCKVVKTLDGLVWLPEIGNEMPEKELHERMQEQLRACGYTGEITVNRNEDTPGQYFNMKIGTGGRYDRIAFHGKLEMSYLDEVFDDEPSSRPKTFRQFWDQAWPEGKPDPARVILSSDGGGGNPKWLPTLKDVACDAFRRGANYDHLLATKRRRFYGDGKTNLDDLAIDEPFLKSLAACR